MDDSDVSELLPPELAKTLNQDETRILNFIGENDQINVSEGHRLLLEESLVSDFYFYLLHRASVFQRSIHPIIFRVTTALNPLVLADSGY